MPQSREETALAPSAAKMRRSKICIVAAAFPHRKSGGRIGRKSRVSAWKRGFCMAFAGGAGRGCGFLKAYMRILRGLQSTAPGIVRRSPCIGASAVPTARGRGACTLHASAPFRSVPSAPLICGGGGRPPFAVRAALPPRGVHPYVRPFVRAFFCVSPCHTAQSMV